MKRYLIILLAMLAVFFIYRQMQDRAIQDKFDHTMYTPLN